MELAYVTVIIVGIIGVLLLFVYICLKMKCKVHLCCKQRYETSGDSCYTPCIKIERNDRSNENNTVELRRLNFTKNYLRPGSMEDILDDEYWYPRSVGVTVADCMTYIKAGLAHSGKQFRNQFKVLENIQRNNATNVACLKHNKHKNRYVNILPFDHSRVILESIKNEPGSDYINANFVPGYHHEKEYIATQGPLNVTINDFWRMVWEQRCTMIVMLTNLAESGKVKCEKYWPDYNDPRVIDEFALELVSEIAFPHFIKRKILIEKEDETRYVIQMHLNTWNDHSVPENPGAVVNFINEIRELVKDVNNPIIVHCSAGVGRTGTFIVIDCLLQILKDRHSNKEINVFSIVHDIRNYRISMVQTEEQYLFIYKCLEFMKMYYESERS